MFWWRHQSSLKKTLYFGAVMSLAAGISAGDKGIVGGALLFLIFFVLALVLPNKSKSKDNKQWIKEITPRTYGNERIMRIFLSIVSLGIFVVCIFLLFRSLLNERYDLAVITGSVGLFCFSSWIYLNPKFYNDFFILQKIVPLRKPETTKQLYEKVKDVATPFGLPLMGFVEGLKVPVAVYRIIDFYWVVFFYVRNDEIIIRARNINPDSEEVNFKESDWVLLFVQQLADLFSYMQNTEEVPDPEIVTKIFKLPFLNNHEN